MDTLLGIREDFGAGYLSALRNWKQRDPGTSNQKVETSLEQYSSALLRECLRVIPTPQTQLELTLRRWIGDPTQDILKNALDLAILSQQLAPLAPFVVIGKFGFSIYRWIDRQPENVRIVITRSVVDLTSPAPLAIQGEKAFE